MLVLSEIRYLDSDAGITLCDGLEAGMGVICEVYK